MRCLAFRFQAFGRPVKNSKKFEEGVFSDLRNLKAGTDAALEEPKSPFLDFLYKNNCIRTQKKQKVFFWYSVPHDRLFIDALERDLKREALGQEATTAAVSDPALSFEYDSTISLYDQLEKAHRGTAAPAFGEVRPAASKSLSRDAESMPPPQTVSLARTRVPAGALSDMQSYSQIPTPIPNLANPMMIATHDHLLRPPSILPHGQAVVPQHFVDILSHPVPNYYTAYAPLPAFDASHSYHVDPTAHGISYCPPTPPHNPADYTSSTQCIPFEAPSFQTIAPRLPQYNAANIAPRHYPSAASIGMCDAVSQDGATLLYANINGTTAYKQHLKHRLSSPFGTIQNGPIFKHNSSARRPSDLRRSISASVPPTDGPVIKANTNKDLKDVMNMDSALLNHGSFSARHAQQEATPAPSRFCSPSDAPLSRHYQHTPMLRGATAMSESHAIAPFSSSCSSARLRRAHSATTAPLLAEKSHSCPIPVCSKTFKRLEHLKRHVRTHTQERPFSCERCDKAFSRSDNLAQ